MDATALSALVREAVPGAAIDVLESQDMPAIAVDRDHMLDVFTALRDHPKLQFALLADVTAIDRLPAEPRFEVVYHLACLGAHYPTTDGPPVEAARLRVKVRLSADAPKVWSLVSVYPTAGWPEREVFDLFGIVFEAHPDLRRILMPEDWVGHPLRKDSPVQIRKDTASWSPLQLTPEEFARNIRAGREAAAKQAGTAPERHE